MPSMLPRVARFPGSLGATAIASLSSASAPFRSPASARSRPFWRWSPSAAHARPRQQTRIISLLPRRMVRDAASERESCTQLNSPRSIVLAVYRAHRRAANNRVGIIEAYGVGEVDELPAELQFPALAPDEALE